MSKCKWPIWARGCSTHTVLIDCLIKAVFMFKNVFGQTFCDYRHFCMTLGDYWRMLQITYSNSLDGMLNFCRNLKSVIFISNEVQNIFPNFICVTYRHFICRMIWKQQKNQNNCKNAYHEICVLQMERFVHTKAFW